MKKDTSKYKIIGSKIKELREKAGISQEELAKKIGFGSATAISLIEAGQRKVSIIDLEKIADFLKCNLDLLLGYEKQKSDIKYVLRSQKNISHEDKQKILNFIEFAEQSYDGKRKHNK